MRPTTSLPPEEREQGVAQVALEKILPNRLQPRKRFPAAQLERLARSIESQGVIQPLIVRPHPSRAGHYELVAGERRLRAIHLLGWREAPALVRQVPDENLLEWALVENLQREPLNPIEEALAYRTLLDRYGYTQESLSRRVGKERSTVANMVRLLALPTALREDLEEERLTTGHARALLAVGEVERQLELRELILARGLSVRETERQVRLRRKLPGKHNRKAARHSPETGRAARDPKFLAVQEALEGRLATRVTINRTENRARDARQEKTGKNSRKDSDGQQGKIEIEFYSLEDFNRLYELLMGE